MIVVFGGNGRVGSALQSIDLKAKFLGRQDCDLSSRDMVRKCLDKYKPEQVVNLAAHFGGKEICYYNNTLINLHVTHECINRGIRLIFVSSSAAYGGEGPHKEGDVHSCVPDDHNIAYAFPKRSNEMHLRSAKYENAVTLYPTNLYGRYDTFGPECHIIPSLILKMKQQNVVTVQKSDSERHFLYLEDFARVIKMVTGSDVYGELNIAPPGLHSIKQIAMYLSDIMGYEGKLEFVEGGEAKILTDTRFNIMFPDFVFTPLISGLKSAYNWYRGICE